MARKAQIPGLDSSSASRKRLNISLPLSSWERVERIMKIMEVETVSEVTKDAFRLLEYFLDVDAKGSRILVEDKSGRTTEVKFF